MPPTLRSWPGPSPEPSPIPEGVHAGTGEAWGSWKGIEFLCEGLSWRGGRRLVQRETPYVPGARQHDLGRQAEAIACDIVFYGPDYRERFEAFRQLLSTRYDPGELRVPFVGAVLTAQVETWELGDTDGARASLRLSVTWLEDSTADYQFAEVLGPSSASSRLPPGEARDSVADYEAATASPECTAAEAATAFRGAIAAAEAYAATLDLDTVAGIEAEYDATLAIAACVRTYPYPDDLEAIR